MVQQGFLRLLSVQARQSVTYHCHRSVAWADRSARNSHGRALHLRGANDEDLSYETSPYIKALVDGCSVSLQTRRSLYECNYMFVGGGRSFSVVMPPAGQLWQHYYE